jgi:hypothetical protein
MSLSDSGMGGVIKATAHKLARLVHAALTKGMVYVDRAWRRRRNATACAPSSILPSALQPLGHSLSPTP